MSGSGKSPILVTGGAGFTPHPHQPVMDCGVETPCDPGGSK